MSRLLRFLYRLLRGSPPTPAIEPRLPEDIDSAESDAMESIRGTRRAVAQSLRATRKDIDAVGRVSQGAHAIAVSQRAIEAIHRNRGR
jgi:hypothetical protein